MREEATGSGCGGEMRMWARRMGIFHAADGSCLEGVGLGISFRWAVKVALI